PVADFRRVTRAEFRARVLLYDRRLFGVAVRARHCPRTRGVLARRLGRRALDRAARRHPGTRIAAPPLQPRGALPAAVHLRAGAHSWRPGQDRVGHAAAVGVAAAEPCRQLRGIWRHHPPLQLVHHGVGSGDRHRFLVHPAAYGVGPHRAGGRTRSRDARRTRRQRRLDLYRHVYAGLVSRRARRRPGDAHQEHCAGYGRGDHRRGLHRRGDRRPRLLLGNFPRRPDLRTGAVLRHPDFSALFHLRRVGADGRHSHCPALGPVGAAPQMKRIPWTIVVLAALLLVPFIGSRFYTFVATDIVIVSLFAMSLNLLLGYTGLVSFGHAAYFGIGAYTCALLMKSANAPFLPSLLAAGLMAGVFALLFGFFCVRLTRIYFAMLTLALAQIVWAICFKWNDVTGGEQGLPNVPYPGMEWMGSVPVLGNFRVGDHFYLMALVIVAVCFAGLRRIVDSPFGRVLTVIRDNPERAQFIGVNVRAYQLAAFVVAGFFAGISGGLFGIFNRGVFPDFAFWTKSAEPLIMTILGGMGSFWGPAGGAAAFIVLNQQITSYTEYWPLTMGTVLIVLLFVFPGGIAGTLTGIVARLRARPPPSATSEPVGEAGMVKPNA